MTHVLTIPPLPRSSRRAFTLIELMISIALVVVLMIGVNKVFQATTTAVGTGQALATAVADSRAAQATFSEDFAGYVANGTDSNDAACTIISCSAVPAFRNKADELGQAKANNTSIPSALQYDLNGNGIVGETTVPGEVISPVTYNFRNHRTDIVSFFARGAFSRQTGNNGSMISDMGTQEAWVWYGHLMLPDNAAVPGYFLPGTGNSSTNPNNFYGSQFTLGRQAMLLKEISVPHDQSGNIVGPQDMYDTNIKTATRTPVPQRYIRPVPKNVLTMSRGNTENGTVPPIYAIEASRYDLARGTISECQKSLAGYVSTLLAGTPWWDATHLDMVYNFGANPFVSRPLTSASAAQTSPIMLSGCSQFVVEFAGDFVSQNNDANDYNAGFVLTAKAPGDGTYGDVQALAPDGTIDFVVDKSAGLTNPAAWKRQIRWYGLPRDTNGDGIAQGYKTGLGNNNLPDVVPVRDVALTNIYSTPFTKFNWEGITNLPTPSSTGDYAKDLPGNASPSYVAAFGPNDPRIKMIRITITLEDPTGRLTDGQTYQYVYTLP